MEPAGGEAKSIDTSARKKGRDENGRRSGRRKALRRLVLVVLEEEELALEECEAPDAERIA